MLKEGEGGKDKVTEHDQRDKFLDEVNASFARLKSDLKARKEEQAERSVWDKTLFDGIEKE